MSVAVILDQVDTEVLVQNWVTIAAREDEIERRERFRLPFFNAATLGSGLRRRAVMCRNISREGIGIIEFGRPPQSKEVALAVSLHNKIVHFEVDIKWTKEIGNGWWTSGGAFRSASIRGASLVVLQLSSMVERRIHRRHTFCHPFSVYPSLDLHNDCVAVENLPLDAAESAFSLDISRGGMRILCSGSFETDKQSVYLRKPNMMTMLRGRIVSQRSLGNGYSVVGIKFPTT